MGSKSGLINEDIFPVWFDHFLHCIQAKSKPDPVRDVFTDEDFLRVNYAAWWITSNSFNVAYSIVIIL